MANRALNRLLLSGLSFLLLFSVAILAQSPTHVYPPKKPTPTEIRPDLMILGNELVQEQWTASLDLVNVPADQKQVEPGQCIRFAVLAIGDDRDQLLKTARIGIDIDFAEKTIALGVAVPSTIKRIKPEGGDFVTEALAAANLKNPVESMVSMGISEARWCVPVETQDGILKITAKAALNNGHTLALNPRIVNVKTFESARRQSAFKNMEKFGSWMQTYHFTPDPAQLLPGMRLVASDQKARSEFNIMAFFIAALKQSPIAAEDILRHLPNEKQETRIYALPLLRTAGYEIKPQLTGFTNEVTAILQTIELPDPFDITPDETLPNKMDMLWATFFANGRIEPVKKLASMLAWREDYEKFSELRRSGKKPTALTDSIMRGVVYMAAGWSINSLSRSDNLVADYIEAIKASPETPARVKAELMTIHTNPAFRKP